MLLNLKPCPFCGGSVGDVICIEGIKSIVLCQKCGAIANYDIWNCRPTEDVLQRRKKNYSKHF